jgi:acid phosphatase
VSIDPRQNYAAAFGDPNQQWLASQGIALTNYFGITHTSEPNYCAAASGDNYGMDNDNFWQIPSNVSTVADLLDTKGISWSEYQEAMPYPGFQGFNYSNQKTFANDYVRKHNPLVLFDSITSNASRLAQIKNFTSFEEDLANQKLPQWSFVTPNMTDDGHDTNVTFASVWERGWISSLLNNSYLMNNTLILLTFDESEQYTIQNNVFGILLGGAIPENLKGTVDNTFYTHYSAIASVSANWGLPSLGRWDCGANLFQVVANKTGYTNYQVDTTNLFLNNSFPGPLSTNTYSTFSPNWPVPVTSGQCSAGNGILDAVVQTYSSHAPTYNYSAPFPYDAIAGFGANVAYSKNGTTFVSGVNTTTVSTASTTTTSSASSATTSKSAADMTAPSVFGSIFAVLIAGLMA